MPRNGSGVYGPPAGTAAVPNTPIESAKYNAFVADASQAFTDSVNVQGTAPLQANQPMGGFKHTNLGAGAAASDSVNLGQAQSGVAAHAATVGGTADAIAVAFLPAFAAYTAKMRFRFTASGANTVTNPTVNVDGLGARTIKKLNAAALAVADIAGAGHVCDCIYDGTDVILLNPALVAGDRKQTFNRPVVKGITVLADAPTIAWDLSTGADFEVTITSNRTLGAFTNSAAGQEGRLTVKQDGTGGWSFNLGNAVYDFWGPSIENIARGPNDVTVYEYKVISAGSMILRRLGATSIGGPSRELLDVKTASNSTSIDFVLAKWLQIYDRFEIDLEDILPATNNVFLWFRTSTNAGSSYDTGASDYLTATSRIITSGGGADGGQGSAAQAQISFISGMSNVVGETGSGTIKLFNPRATGPFKFSSRFGFYGVGPLVQEIRMFGVRNTAADVDAARFLMSSGSIASGTFRLYGIRG
jgi:hypothetical protein